MLETAGTSNRRTRHNQETQRSGQNATLDVVDFAVARALELRSLRDAVSSFSGTRRVYQQLAWHSRRRTMSHSSRRMPARLRAAHAAQLEKQRPPGTAERPPGPKGAARCRKYRKKARFLQAIRRLRSRNPAWLETHIWHAKRFVMGDIGGRRVAVRCNDRGYRSAYKAATRACVVHDASYLDVIEIYGDFISLKTVLKAVTGPHSDRVATNPVIKGCCWVTDVIIMDGEKVVGPSDVLWRPSPVHLDYDLLNDKEMKVWLWVHPHLTDTVLQCVQKRAKDGTNVHKLTAAPQRFSLYGPRSGIVLASVLCDTDATFTHVARARSSNCLPSGCVISGKAEDPRANFPPKRMAENADKVGHDGDYGDAFKSVATSELWSETEREMWSERIASGKGKAVEDRIPYMLLQRTMAVAAGYELLVPPGTGMVFWNSLMYANGARAVGIEEMKRVRMENLMEMFPEDYQDGERGFALIEKEGAKEEEKHNKRPPAKRVNYALNRITSPMIADLEGIAMNEIKLLGQRRKRIKLDEESEAQKVARIIRSRSLLQQLLGAHVYQQLLDGSERRKDSGRFAQALHETQSEVSEQHCTHFVRVCIRPLSRGVPERNGIVCEPNAADVDGMRRLGAKFSGEEERKSDAKRGDTKATREVIGYLSVGGWSMSSGTPLGTGLVAVSALRRLAHVRECGGARGGSGKVRNGAYVLFRNVKSRQYRGAIVSVLAPQL
eukprot:TRINITY_DN3213_c0_g1_i1.p1 TRINITY_DN3213_c0_g1~~TRINITY_DN3213_c0_g1_i1.p1  ORF type:complete len:722 (-),score=104.67 TRINITY_DN3213_c0_g1_i1:3270-5435(-)